MSTPRPPSKQPAVQPPELAAIEQPAVQSSDVLATSILEELVVHSITVCCRRPAGLWRAGRFWPAEPVTLRLDVFTEEQIERIVAEPLLDFAFVAGDLPE